MSLVSCQLSVVKNFLVIFFVCPFSTPFLIFLTFGIAIAPQTSLES
ncbi:MAG: hypothetical protein ACK5RT_01310 [Dolichospermum sp.]